MMELTLLVFIALSIVLLHVEAQCSYPGSVKIADGEYPGPTASCGIDYSVLTDTATSDEALRAEYGARCGGVITGDSPIYRIGGLGIRGDITFYDQYRDTFESVLNEQLACSKGILFQAIALDFDRQSDLIERDVLDFVYSNPSTFSCFMASYGLRPIMSQVNFREVNGDTYELEYFGGTIFVRADSDITKVSDIRDQRLRVSAVKTSGLGAMQLQWLHLLQKGIYLFADASMVMFAQSQRRIVYDVLSGRADVGFVRTDQIEGMDGLELNNGEKFSTSMVRILEPIAHHPEYNGTAQEFPFESTTALTPEWPLGMQASVPEDVAWDVMSVLQGIQQTDAAAVAGNYVRWRAPLDYMSLVKLNINLDIMDITTGQCDSAEDVYSPVTCPPGAFKKPQDLVNGNCQQLGLAGKTEGDSDDCFNLFYDAALGEADPDAALAQARASALAQGYIADDSVILETRKYQCVCDPCAPIPEEAITVRPTRLRRDGTVYEGDELVSLLSLDSAASTCERLEPCFDAQEGDIVTLQVVDQLGFAGRSTLGLPMVQSVEWAHIGAASVASADSVAVANGISVEWEFDVTMDSVGTLLTRVLADGSNIEASPFAVSVRSRPSSGLASWMIALIASAAIMMLVLVISVVVLLIRSQAPAFTLEEHYARIAAEMLGDIQFVKLLGAGSFGKVYHAVWQGSHVAVKVIEHVNAQVIEMAEREARLSTDLAHPNIVMTLHYAVRGANGTTVGSVGATDGAASAHSGVTNAGFLLRLMMGSKASNASMHNSSMHATAFGRSSNRHSVAERTSAEKATSPWYKRNRSKSDGKSSANSRSNSTGANTPVNNRQRIQSLIKSAEQDKAALGEAIEAPGDDAQPTLDVVIACDDPVPPTELATQVGRESQTTAKTVRYQDEQVHTEGADSESAEDLDVVDSELVGGNTWGTFSEGLAGTQPASDRQSPAQGARPSGADDDALSVQTWIIQEYCDKGSLSSMMQRRPFRDDRESPPKMAVVLKTVLDVAKGMLYLHEKGIVHSDLKTGNVLLQSVGDDVRGFRAKVADFGLSRALEDGSQTIQTNTFGTVTHMPPELLKDGRLTEAADVYSFGMLMWEVYCGRHPFGNCSHAEIVTRVIVKGERPVWPSSCSNLYSSIAERCWSAAEKDRPSFEMVVAQLDALQNSLA